MENAFLVTFLSVWYLKHVRIPKKKMRCLPFFFPPCC